MAGMDIIRGNQQLQKRVQAAIDPFVPRAQRGEFNYSLYLHCAAQQLGDKEFNPASLIAALAAFAAAGIVPNSHLHWGYLIPYKGIVTPVFGYQGLIHLAYEAQSANGSKLVDVVSDLILETDPCDRDGTPEQMAESHRPRGDRDPRKDPIDRTVCAYARFRYAMPVGGLIHEFSRVEVMTPSELQSVKTGRGDGWKNYPWRMHQKAPLRRACASGRVRLAYMAGLALNAEGAAASGDMARYKSAAIGLAAAAPNAALEDAIDATFVDERSPIDEYLAQGASLRGQLRNPECSLDDAQRAVAMLVDIWQSVGCPGDWHDEGAETSYSEIKRHYATNT